MSLLSVGITLAGIGLFLLIVMIILLTFQFNGAYLLGMLVGIILIVVGVLIAMLI